MTYEAPNSLNSFLDAFGEEPIDYLIYCAGIWDESADKHEVDVERIYGVMSVNLSGFVSIALAMRRSLLSSPRRPLIVGIGSISGLPNSGSLRPAYCASKAGMRGAVSAIREELRETSIGISCLFLGSFNSSDGSEAKSLGAETMSRIPLSDILATLIFLQSLSPSAVPKEIVLPANADAGV